ncbi:hypothetical protein OS187_10205 [Xanthomonadaceae bacterium JHOS43]|nr:hypothetical protein [Xanthomonadaceae bacterium JHOS43]
MRAHLGLLLLATLLPSADAEAAVRRCIAADGTTIYTDRPCEHFDARDSAPPSEPEGNAPALPPRLPGESPLSAYGPVHADCARTPEALLFTLRRTLEHRDINALAGLYHWPGMGRFSATTVMNQLEALAADSDGSADLIYPDAAFVVHDPQAYPDLPPEDPIGVRLPAFHAGGLSEAAPDAATLRVVRHAGCWWLTF